MSARILVIEDDEGITRFLRRGLAYEGYIVDTATDGRSGLLMARDNHPDLVVLDWMLPGMDGFEVARRLLHYLVLAIGFAIATGGDHVLVRHTEHLFAKGAIERQSA